MQAGATRVSKKPPVHPSQAMRHLRGPRLWEHGLFPTAPAARPLSRSRGRCGKPQLSLKLSLRHRVPVEPNGTSSLTCASAETSFLSQRYRPLRSLLQDDHARQGL